MKAIPAREKQDPTLSVVDNTLSWWCVKSCIFAAVEMLNHNNRTAVTLGSWTKAYLPYVVRNM